MRKETIDTLNAEIKAHYKPGAGGIKYKYIKGEDVISRLNTAFQHEWSSEVKETLKVENQVIVRVALTAEGVTHEGFGGAEVAVYKDGFKKGQPIDISNSYKSAFTNALKKAAEQFGIGLTSEDDYVPEVPFEQEEPSLPKHNAPPVPGEVPSQPIVGSAVLSSKKVEEGAKLPEGTDIKALEEQIRKLMGTGALEDKYVPAEKEKPPVQSLASSFKKTYNPQQLRQPDAPNPFSKTTAPEDTINDIQLSALSGLTKLKKVSASDAISKAIPSSNKTKYEDLTKDEARLVIQLLNNIS